MKRGDFFGKERVFIVAEIGNNHEGKLDLAHSLIDKAAESGVDAVKFQTFRTELFVSRKETARFERLKSFELSFNDFESLRVHAESLGLCFFSTPLDLESARFLCEQCPLVKIASSDNNFDPLLELVARSGRPLIVSGGISTLEELSRTRDLVQRVWNEHRIVGELAFLHCVTAYPTPPVDVHLRVIPELRRVLGTTVGYSDHSLGATACLGAVALGARIIEKHFTVDCNYSSFRDHALSLDPAQMKMLVTQIRELEAMLGGTVKEIRSGEQSLESAVRRGAYAARALKAGDRLGAEDILWLRPSTALAPSDHGRLIGRALPEAVKEGDPIPESTLGAV